ncbi:O-succinylbenzoic acid--CoA ligase [Bacillus mesophilus]|uniref:2-succinylbenzoate--CoA ligase n=1 Tax=Bacillus mesophilus TaxID=1808955 RepID=A0A6M0QAC1_9BACI|nr:o-succinylbenzoate--CoA ligase [Bacillus mesophilus]MBM7660430.1 O-succinylbenzoic acid--CoA ligase [Bacillus mesophilus]NEY72018.1 o-succinylbenzoate--CoA ligase [Bacillus mesophilus]
MLVQQEVPNWLLQRAFLTPNRVALKMGEREITFSSLHTQVLQMAGRLSTLGIQKGTKVGLLSHNSIEMIEVIHAIKYLGGVTVLLNTRLTANEIAWQLQDANTEFLVTDSTFSTSLHIVINIPVFSFDTLYDIQPDENVRIQEEFNLMDIDTIMYTSGTTGKPKGVIQTYGNHYWSSIGSALNLGIHQDDCWLACVPFFHVSGLSILMKSVIYGMKVIVQEQFDHIKVNRAIMEENVTMISVVSTMLTQMVDHLERFHFRYPASLRCVLLGGGPAPKVLLEKGKEYNIPVFQTYGMTETASQIVTLAPEDSLNKLGSAGKPLFHSQIKIIENGEEQPAMKAGEIVVKGPTVTYGYLNQPEATQSSIKEGWLHTGDIGYVDDEGFLFVLDRRKDLIISGGENIYPAEIEGVLLSHPKITEAGVVGILDEKWGQVPVAFVVGVELTSQEVEAYCKAQLAKYKVPKQIYFVSSLPRNATNKLQRHKLQELVKIDKG